MTNYARNLYMLFFALCLSSPLAGQSKSLKVRLDTDQVPELNPWGEEAKQLILRWQPRICNLLPSVASEVSNHVELVINKSEKGVGGTLGNKIGISSGWIKKHPEDFGLVIHELVHVIQRYPSPKPTWVTEGIADYIRWAIYEGKEQTWFPFPDEKHGYKKGYRVAAGFLLWLESDLSPGIVKQLNTAMRQQKYTDEIFRDRSGKPLEQLWDEYLKFRKR